MSVPLWQQQEISFAHHDDAVTQVDVALVLRHHVKQGVSAGCLVGHGGYGQ